MLPTHPAPRSNLPGSDPSDRGPARSLPRTPAAALAGLLLLGASVSPALAAQSPASPADARTPKVLVVGIDGVRPDVLAASDTPHLDGLIARGFYSDRAEMRFPTVSGPGWSSFLTGVWLDRHGVVNNEFTGDQYDRWPDFLTRIETARPELRTFAVADWLPLVVSSTARPTIGDGIDRKVILDGYGFGWEEADRISVDAAVRELASEDPDAMFVYLGNPDETSHRTGSIGEPYRAAIHEADRQVGRLLEAIEARSTRDAERWLIVASTDHGRTENGGHGGNSEEERTIWFLVSGDGADPEWSGPTPRIVDVAATALAHMGVAAPGLAGRPVGLRVEGRD